MDIHKEADSTRFIATAAMELLAPDKNTAVLTKALRDAITARNEPASRYLFTLLRQCVESETNMEGLLRAIMEIYPSGSLQEQCSNSKPILLGLRKDMLTLIVDQWCGDPSEIQAEIFLFLRDALLPGMDEVGLLPEEKKLVEALVRRRLEDATTFTECKLRSLMTFLKRRHGTFHADANNFFMLLAIARTRNGGLDSALLDIHGRGEPSS